MYHDLLNISSNPHIKSKINIITIMKTVIISLLPTTLFGIYNFGINALLIIFISIITCVFTDILYEYFLKNKNININYSSIVTGLLLALNLPISVPKWIPIIGGIFAILIVKQFFGGLGQNFMNPALTSRCFLLISFTSIMTNFNVQKNFYCKIIDTISGATPLAALKIGEKTDVMSLFLGNTQGTIGETSVFAILIGVSILLIKNIVDYKIPCIYILTFSIFIFIFSNYKFDINYLIIHLFSGGLMLGAWFMATDYVTIPITDTGKIIYGILLGIFTGFFRIFGNSAEGVSYAIIFCNLLIPIINNIIMFNKFKEKR